MPTEHIARRSSAVAILKSLATLALTLAVLGGSGADVHAGEIRPPLLPGEVLVLTQNGCGVVLKQDGAQSHVRRVIDEAFVRARVWAGGDCEDGLVDGWGILALQGQSRGGHEARFVFGRLIAERMPEAADPAVFGNRIGSTEVRYDLDGKTFLVADLPPSITPRWVSGFGSGGTRLLSPNGRILVSTFRTPCPALTDWTGPCEFSNQYDVFGVEAIVGEKLWRFWCPDPRTSVGCERVWHEKARPVVEAIRAFDAIADKQIAADTEKFRRLSEAWIAEREAPRREAARRAAEDVALDREVAAREQQQRDAADEADQRKALAARKQAEAAFKARLARLNPGELFALADAQRSEGNIEQEREVLRALLTRFPNHALATLAAQQLSKLAARDAQGQPSSREASRAGIK